MFGPRQLSDERKSALVWTGLTRFPAACTEALEVRSFRLFLRLGVVLIGSRRPQNPFPAQTPTKIALVQAKAPPIPWNVSW